MTEEKPAKAAGQAPREQKKQKERRRHWPALLKRFPRFFWRPREDGDWKGDWAGVPPEAMDEYKTLAQDAGEWRDQLEARSRTRRHRRQVQQNQFWRRRGILIVG